LRNSFVGLEPKVAQGGNLGLEGATALRLRNAFVGPKAAQGGNLGLEGNRVAVEVVGRRLVGLKPSKKTQPPSARCFAPAATFASLSTFC
jgi:hypothetical protein